MLAISPGPQRAPHRFLAPSFFPIWLNTYDTSRQIKTHTLMLPCMQIRSLISSLAKQSLCRHAASFPLPQHSEPVVGVNWRQLLRLSTAVMLEGVRRQLLLRGFTGCAQLVSVRPNHHSSQPTASSYIGLIKHGVDCLRLRLIKSP